MRTAIILSAALFSLATTASANAQATSTTTSTTTATHAATTTSTDKATLSKSCSGQANAKGLHGKARKTFRSDCKHGKA